MMTTAQRQQRIIVCLFAVLAMMFSGSLQAAGWVFRPSASITGIYNDNFRLATSNEDDVLTTALTGELKLSRRTDLTDLTGLIRADFASYSGEDQPLRDTNNQLAELGYERKGELSRWGIDSVLKRDSLLRKVDIVVDPDDVTIEPDDDVDDGLVRENVERFRLRITPSWSRQLSELTGINARYNFSQTDYDDVGATDLFEFTFHEVQAGLSTRITEKDSLVSSVGATFYRAPDVDREYDSYSLDGGLEHEFTETLKAGFSLGVRQTSFDVLNDSGDDTGFTARIDGSKRTGLTIFSGRLNRKLRSSGSGDVVQTDEVVFNVSRRISELLQFSLRTRLFENESLRRNNSDANRRFFSFSPRLRWSLTRWLSFDTNYRYRREKRFNEPGVSESNAVFVSLNYSRPTALDE